MSEPRRTGPLDRLLAEHRAVLDAEVVRSGAPTRVRNAVLTLYSADPLAGLRWQRIAAAVLVAGMLGGAVDLLAPEGATESVDVAIVDALYVLDQPDEQ
jgi:hypothetical protein